MPTTTVLLTGASGLLGTSMRRTTPAAVAVVGLVNERSIVETPTVTADLRDAVATRMAVGQVRPDLVIHAAYAHDEASIVDATRHLVAAAGEVGATVVFVSTDAVFSGDGLPRAEGAVPDPIADYGRWKARAEQITLQGGDRPAVVRLPLLVSLDPADPVVVRIRDGAARGTTTRWFADEMRQPAMANEVAEALWRIVKLDPSERSGVWHLPGPEVLSRFAVARRVVTALGLDDEVIAAESTPLAAVRPRDLRLEPGRAIRAIGWAPSPILTAPMCA